MVDVQQHSQTNNRGMELRFKEEPWCGKHISSGQESTMAKNVYNYAQKNRNTDKTPMCRIAELARFHKLKHEYILLDESGPAHKKQFTVKLVLKAGEEYEGVGPSIKKAQQSAAENALFGTALQLPPRRSSRSKNETNPVCLLYSVASQLGLGVEFEEHIEVLLPSNKSTFMVSPPPPNSFIDSGQLPVFPFGGIQNGHSTGFKFAAPLRNVYNGFQSSAPAGFPMSSFGQEQKPEIICAPWSSLANSMSSGFPQPPDAPCNFIPPHSSMPRIPASVGRLPPPLIPLHSQLNTQPNTQSNVYRCSYILSDGSEHHGEGRTSNIAKASAALNALFSLRPLLSEMEAKMKDEKRSEGQDPRKKHVNDSFSNSIDVTKPKEESLTSESDEENEEEMCTIACGNDKREDQAPKQQGRSKPKSVVSQIHECAYRLKMNVEFEVIEETGEPHNRRYVLRCSFSSPHSQPIVAIGEGSSKKLAKQNACQLMLEKIKGFDQDALYLASVIVKQAAKKGTATGNTNKESKRKTIIKDMKKDPHYGQHINPISRLIQVMQGRKEDEPAFRLVGERGQNRYREFVVEVICGDMTLTGVGPNKKLAKRAAAVAMLEQIGYIKPMPSPGKSLLKKRSSDSMQTQVEIGVFDPNELASASPQATRQFSPEATSIDSPPIPISADSNTETFAYVDSALSQEISQMRFSSDSISPPVVGEETRTRSDSEKQEDPQPIRSQRRRVTFSNQVSACPPPEDCSYPDSTIAPLKSEVVLVTKLKKRGRDSKKALTSEEKRQIAAICHLFCQLPNGRELRSGYMTNDGGMTPTSPDTEYLDFGQSPLISPIQLPSTPVANTDFQPLGPSKQSQHPLTVVTPIISSAPLPIDLISPSQLPANLSVQDSKFCLERLAKQYKFTVSYSDFPKGSMDEYFSLVTVGLDKPILCHGCGSSEEQAHADAAYNAIFHLSFVESQKPSSN